MPVTAKCGSCSKKFKANDKLAGKRVKCPQCGGAIKIPATGPAASSGSMASLLDEESVPARPAVKPKPQPTRKPKAAVGKCPACSAEIATEAVLCVNCGLDLRTGKPVEIGEAAAAGASRAKKKKKKKKKRGETPQAVMFLRGCAVSFGCAMVGAFAWWLAAYFWDVQFGIIAWVIGGLAGAGMSFGYDVEDLLSGLAAAAIAFFAIFVAKVLVLIAIISNEAPPLREQIVDARMEGAFDEEFQGDEPSDLDIMPESEATMEEGVDVESAEEDQVDDYEGGNEEGNEVLREEYSVDESREEFADEFEDSEIPDAAVGAILGMAAIITGFCWMFWPPFNTLFLLFACATAYHVGSGGGWSD